jgi:PilZ domain
VEERRKYPRIHFGFRIEDATGKKAWMTEDISSGGCFLQKLEETPIGSKISLVFQLPGSPKYIDAVGEVKHLKERGAGIEFIAIDSEDRKATEEFVKGFIKYET